MHLHLLGATGTGKSKAIEHQIKQHIVNGNGVCLIDPDGQLCNAIVKWCAHWDIDKRRTIHIINPEIEGWTVGFNPLRLEDGDEPIRRVRAAVEACTQVWGSEDLNAKPRLRKCLTAVFYALAFNHLTLAESTKLATFIDEMGIRKFLTHALQNKVYRDVWGEYNALERMQDWDTHFESTMNRVTALVENPSVYTMLGAGSGGIDFRKVMDNDEIVLVNLSIGDVLSAEDARIIGTMITNDLFSLARTRDEATAKAHPFFLYIDECHDFLTDDIVGMLDRTRKFGLHAALAHQRLDQLRDAGKNIYSGVMGSARNKMLFALEFDEDAEVMSRQIFRAEFDLEQEKTKLNKPTVVGFEIDWLESQSSSGTESWGESSGMGSSIGGTFATVDVLDGDGNIVGQTTMASETTGSSEIGAKSEGGSRSAAQGRHQALRPVLEELPTALKSLEEVAHEAIVKIRELPRATAIVKPIGKKSALVSVPFVDNSAASATTVEAFMNRVLENSPYSLPVAEVTATIEARHEALVLQAQDWEFSKGHDALEVVKNDDDAFLM